jgi:pyruvate/2-oxoglutarate dehydrogenase complex dihydrolipoamide acyltransferase (E2) component
MANEFRLPDIGEGLVEVEITHWHVPVGGRVEVDQSIVEVETEKAVTDMPSPFAGTVLYHGAAEGEVLPVGEILFVVGEPGESWAPNQTADAAPSADDARPIVGTLGSDADILPPRSGAQEVSPAPAAPAGATPRAEPHGNGPIVGPLVRQLAGDLGVDLQTVTGSGPGGRIRREDVLGAAPDAATSTEAPPAREERASRPVADDERRPLSKLRRTIASNLTRSWTEIPHVTSFWEVDATRLLQMRDAIRARHDVRVPIDALAILAVVPALRAYPEFNSSIDGDDLVVHHRHDIGVAIDAPDGLIVAVVRDAASRGLLELTSEVKRLGEAARDRTLKPAEVNGQTFTVSNIGAVSGGGHGTPIIPLGTAAVLGVGRVADKPVARDGRVEVAPVMPLSFSFDHRIADGGTGRRFMSMVVENLADPTLLLV